MKNVNFRREKYLDSQVVVVSLFGKSSHLSRGCKADIFDKVLGYSIFKKCMLDSSEINEEFLVRTGLNKFARRKHNALTVGMCLQCNIEGFYDKKGNVIYLHLVGGLDTHSLLKMYELYAVQLEERVSIVYL